MVVVVVGWLVGGWWWWLVVVLGLATGKEVGWALIQVMRPSPFRRVTEHAMRACGSGPHAINYTLVAILRASTAFGAGRPGRAFTTGFSMVLGCFYWTHTGRSGGVRAR